MNIKIGQTTLKALLDTGSSVSIISSLAFTKIKSRFVEKVNTKDRFDNVISASGDKLDVLGQYNVRFSLTGNDSFLHKFLVVGNIKIEVILGIDFIRKNKLVIDGAGTVEFVQEKQKHRIVAATTATQPINRKPFPFQLNHLEDEEREKLAKLIDEEKDLFASSLFELGRARPFDFKIRDNDNPVYTRPYRTPITQRPIMKQLIKEMLANKIISPSTSSYNSPALLVKKADNSVRFVVDYRMVNSQSQRINYPLPRISDIMDRLRGSFIMTSLDCFSGYWNIGHASLRTPEDGFYRGRRRALRV